ncbi:AlgP family protein [Pseudomonas saliphila]|uniref:AlgP family protein n=1 Tax=Pseudomonas saliphila TaxID=2586906 RepID=UPI00123B8966|nr:AlgP family protein [Pseudomonas saliphila]
MTATSPGKKSSRVPTPLHLLQTLTRTLNEQLAEACEQAEQDAVKALEKLDRQKAKLDEKLSEARGKLAARQSGEEHKSVSKAQARVDELEAALVELSDARNSADAYVKQLRLDIRQTLRLAKGFERIDGQVSQAIDKRDNPDQAPAPRPRSGPRRSRAKSANQKPTTTAKTA